MNPCPICGLGEPEGILVHECPPGFLHSVAEHVKTPLEKWAGNCHGISMAVSDALDAGTVQRGYYFGPRDPDSYFGEMLCQHSWIELPNGDVLDPTRHAFVGGEPKLYIIERELAREEYRAGYKISPTLPPPDFFNSTDEPITLELGCAGYVADLLGTPGEFFGQEEEDGWVMASPEQVLWLANLPVQDKEDPHALCMFFAAEVYEAIEEAGEGGFIPIDRRKFVLGG